MQSGRFKNFSKTEYHKQKGMRTHLVSCMMLLAELFVNTILTKFGDSVAGDGEDVDAQGYSAMTIACQPSLTEDSVTLFAPAQVYIGLR